MSDLDSTQTMRALSAEELYDSQRPRWHVVQLVVSDKPVNLDMMPRLEVFTAHRLYVVAAKQAGALQYSLRLGFFPAEDSAEAICGYLRTFFSSPSVMRVSAAEHARFSQPAAPRAGEQKPPSRPARAPTAMPAQPVARQPTAAEKSGNVLPRSNQASGSQKPLKRAKTLAQELLEEAREVQLSRSGKHRTAQHSNTWLARLFGGSNR